ncbi:MAG: tetratricopeptide repeat protein, partial [Planctomycetia bacterium]
AIVLTRLGWVLQRLNDAPTSERVLEKAVALSPDESDVRRELAGVLLAVGKAREAKEMYDGVELTFDDKLRMLSIHSALKEFDEAVALCDAVLKQKPGDPALLRLKADVLGWNREYKSAEILYRQLLAGKPNDPELSMKAAEMALWGNDTVRAMSDFQRLFEKNPTRREVWGGYLDAVGNMPTTTPTAAQVQGVKRIYALAVKPVGEEPTRDPMLLARLGRAMIKIGDPKAAAELTARAVEIGSPDQAVRRELAAVLLAVDKPLDALKMYEGVEPNIDDRLRLVAIYSALNRFADAEGEARKVLADRPMDLKLKRLLADVLSWNKNYDESLALFDELIRLDSTDPSLPRRRAEVTLWSKQYDLALQLLQPLVDDEAADQPLYINYIDAVSSAKRVTKDDEQIIATLRRIAEYTETIKEPPTRSFLARLAWALVRVKEEALAGVMLDRALNPEPTDHEVRREVSGVLLAVGRAREALGMFKGLKLTTDDYLRLFDIYATLSMFDDADKAIRAVMQERPKDPEVLYRLAEVSTWRNQHGEALKIYAKVAADKESDRFPDLPLKVARAALWSKNFSKATELFEELLDRDFNQPKLWESYLEAVAATGEVPAEAKPTVVKIYNATRSDDSRTAAFLARLAWVLARLDESQKARELIARVTRLNPRERNTRLTAADTLYELGDFQAAEREYENLLSIGATEDAAATTTTTRPRPRRANNAVRLTD